MLNSTFELKFPVAFLLCVITSLSFFVSSLLFSRLSIPLFWPHLTLLLSSSILLNNFLCINVKTGQTPFIWCSSRVYLQITWFYPQLSIWLTWINKWTNLSLFLSLQKERDLELAAKIGQTLLEKNKYFEEKNDHLEELVAQATEKINQLKHDLSMKEELLKIYTENYDGTDSSYGEDDSPDNPNVPFLQKKIKNLEDENSTLHNEVRRFIE